LSLSVYWEPIKIRQSGAGWTVMMR